jgi:hypothetical protein
MDIDQEVTGHFVPIYPDQKSISYCIYYTREYDAEYTDEHGMRLLGKLHIDLPGSGLNRRALLQLTFGKMEITATSKNEQNGQSYKATFNFNFD